MIAYLDSSVLSRAYLLDEDGQENAVALLDDPEIAPVTGTWTRIEVSGALVRAARAGRGDEKGLLAVLDADLAGRVIVLSAPQDEVQQHALELVRRHALRAMDPWHLALAAHVVPPLLDPGEQRAFASRDQPQRLVAKDLGFIALYAARASVDTARSQLIGDYRGFRHSWRGVPERAQPRRNMAAAGFSYYDTTV